MYASVKIVLHTLVTSTVCLTEPRQSADGCSLKDEYSDIYTGPEEEFTKSKLGLFVSHVVWFQLREIGNPSISSQHVVSPIKSTRYESRQHIAIIGCRQGKL